MMETVRDRIAPIVAGLVAEGRAQGLEGRALLNYARSGRPVWVGKSNNAMKVWLAEFKRLTGGALK